MPPETGAKVTVDKERDIKKVEEPESLADQYRKKMGELIKLSREQEKRLKSFLKEKIKEWESDTSDLEQILIDDNDLVEGITNEEPWPYEGASNTHVAVTEMYMEVFKSVKKRSILGSDDIWYADTDEQQLFELTDEVSEAFNYNAVNKWNIKDAIEGVIWTTDRDGLGILEVDWVEEYENVTDVVLLTDEDDFLEEFPSPEEAGLSQEDWDALRQRTINEADVDFPLEVPIEVEKEKYFGPRAEIVELVDFVRWPVTIRNLQDSSLRLYGKRFRLDKPTIRDNKAKEFYYEDASNKLLKKKASSTSTSTFYQAQNDIEGIRRSGSDDTFKAFRLVVKGHLDGKEDKDAPMKKYLVTYALDDDALLEVRPFPYRVDHYALFNINKRPNRLIGRSIPRKTRASNEEIDRGHNQRINSRDIFTIPSFKGKRSAKKDFDAEAEENRWFPGVIFWLDDPETFEQFKVQPTDLGESMAEEQNSLRMLDQLLGSSVALLSGQTPTGDPDAPGNKVAALIGQTNLRMDDPISEFRDGVEQVGDICLSHVYQFGRIELPFRSPGQDGSEALSEFKYLHKKILRDGFRMKMKGVTVVMNPDAEMQKLLIIYATLSKDPTWAQNSKLRFKVLQDALRKGRIQNREKYLPSLEELQREAVEVQKQAILELAAQKKKAEEDAQKKRLSDTKRELDIKNTAERVAEEGLSVNGEQSQ